MKKKLPKTIYVCFEDDGHGDEFLVAYPSWDEHCEVGVRKLVGTYELVAIGDVVSDSKLIPRKAR